VLSSALLLAAPAAAEAAQWVIKGRGWGHGVGMSQYGAYGFAQRGTGYKGILDHYYRHTELGRNRDGKVSVLLSAHVGEVAFSDAKRACGERLREDRSYRFGEADGQVILRSSSGHKLANCGPSGSADGGTAVHLHGKGSYRGRLVARPDSGALNAINVVGLDAYLKGVVPNEMPAAWPRDALRAQAVVARSYALVDRLNGVGFDLYDDTRSQVYGGLASESPETTRAVKATTGEVVVHRGEVVPTYYFSTSGGATESVEHGFPGSEPQPYLAGVRDPHDDASPYHRWREKLSEAQMEDRLGGLVHGDLRAIKVTRTGDSPRIVRANVVSSGGVEDVGGLTLQDRLGLRSTWARFKKPDRGARQSRRQPSGYGWIGIPWSVSRIPSS
jgi:stage II sporulation protein D